MIKKTELSIVVPVYNEATHIVNSLEIIFGYAFEKTASVEIIVIDDGSTDNTWLVLKRLAKDMNWLRPVKLSRNFGKEAAICAGLDLAAGEAVIIMDGDLQHPPSMIPLMIEIWRSQQVDVVECVKIGQKQGNCFYRFSSGVFYWILKVCSGQDLYGSSDFKLLNAKAVAAWRSLPEGNTFFRGMVAWLGFSKIKLEFAVAERAEGSTKWSIFSLIHLAIKAVVSFSSIPLYLISIVGGFFLVGAFLLGLQTLYNKFTGIAESGFTTIILLILITGGMIMVSLGIIGHYLSTVYHEVKRRPRYLISEKVDWDA